MELINTDKGLVVDKINSICLNATSRDGKEINISFEIGKNIESNINITSHYEETFDRGVCVYHCLDNTELLIKAIAKNINYKVCCGE